MQPRPSEHRFEGLGVDQHPALDVRVGNGDDEPPWMSEVEWLRLLLDSPAASRALAIRIGGHNKEVGKGFPAPMDVVEVLPELAQDFSVSTTDAPGMDRDFDPGLGGDTEDEGSEELFVAEVFGEESDVNHPGLPGGSAETRGEALPRRRELIRPLIL